MINLQKSLLSGLAILTLSFPAIAQETTANGQTYEPAYFEQYAPRTALDMVGRIPGFQIQGSDNRRGLGQGGANVLINGERISGKTDVGSQLGRITATNVVRIEIKDGASLDIPGLSGQVANVITSTKGISGTWEWNPDWRDGLEANIFNSSATISGETGNLSYSGEVKLSSNRNGHRGPEKQFATDGTLFEVRDEDAQYYGDRPGASISLTWKPADDHVANLNLEYNQPNFNLRENSFHRAITPRGENAQTLFTFAEDEWNAEAGGDYEFPLSMKDNGGKLKLIGYYRFEHSPTFARFDTFDATGQTGGSRFNRVADEAETIARAEYSWSPSDGKDWQLGIEGAFNYLDIASNLSVRNAAGVFENVATAGTSSRVEEKRAEATLTHSRKLTPKWDLQVSLGGEYSELTQAGAAPRDFVRPKGFVAATYKANKALTINAKLEREVGQLNFFDFISSLSLRDGQNSTGNPDLVPSQSWNAELEFDKQFKGGHTFKAKFYGQQISDIVDRIPVGANGDAVGNIDTANQYGVDFTATLKGEQWGFKGVEVEAVLDLRNSNVDDPIGGFSRRLNNDKIIYWNASFRHDIPDTPWAYGGFIDSYKPAKSFRLNTISQQSNTNPFAIVFVEHKDIFGLKVKVRALNLLGTTDDFTRDFFTDRRDIGVLDFTEIQSRETGVFYDLTISGTF